MVSSVKDDSLEGQCIEVPTFNISPRGIINAIILFSNALFIIFKYRLKLIISTGSEVAVPFIYYGIFFRTKVIYIECSAQVYRASMTGRIVY